MSAWICGLRRCRMGAPALAWLLLAAAAHAQATSPADEGEKKSAAAASEQDEEETGETARPGEPAPAPPGIEEIVITGSVQVGPSLAETQSVALFDAKDIQALGAQDISDLAAYTPNVSIPTAGSTSPTFFVRGIGLSDYNANSTGAIAIFRDGVPINSPAIQLGLLYDVEQVQILRGPQSTGPYRNASGGAINISALRPTGDYGGSLTASYGHFDDRDFQGYVEAPILQDVLAGRISFRLRERDGYISNSCANAPPRSQRAVATSSTNLAAAQICHENILPKSGPRIPPTNPAFSDGISPIPEGLPRQLNDIGTWGARGQLLFTPDENWLPMTWLLQVHGNNVDELSTLGVAYGDRSDVLGSADGGGYTDPDVNALFLQTRTYLQSRGLTGSALNQAAQDAVASRLANRLDPDPLRGDYNRVGKTTLDNVGGFLEGKLDFGPVQLLSRTGAEWYDRFRDVDQDFTPNVLFETVTSDRATQATQELTLSGDLLDGQLRWHAGGLALWERLDAVAQTFFNASTVGTKASEADRWFTEKTTDLLAFGDFTYDFSDDWKLEAGIRYNREKKKFFYQLARLGQTLPRTPHEIWDAPTWMVSLTYKLSDVSSIYFKQSRGWKAGHFNASASTFRGATTANPEFIDASEWGFKTSYFDDRVKLDGAMFYYKYQDYQILVVQPDSDIPNLEFINAQGAEVYGAEASVDLYPIRDLDLVPSGFSELHLDVNFGWLHSQFLKFTQDIVRTVLESQNVPPQVRQFLVENDYTGNTLPNAPPFMLSISAEWPFDFGRFGTVTPRWDANWSDEVFFDQTEGRGFGNPNGKIILPNDAIGQRARWQHSLRLAYQTPDGSIEVAGWVHNLLNDVYKIYAFDATNFGRVVVAYLSEPRTYGGELTFRF